MVGPLSDPVPRTRSSHHNCRESGCELRVQSGTRIIGLLVSFDSEVRIGRAARFGELRNRDTKFSYKRARFAGPPRKLLLGPTVAAFPGVFAVSRCAYVNGR